MARPFHASFAIRGLTAQFALLGLLAAADPASAQGLFGEQPPRPPSSVPTRPGRSLPPPGQYPAEPGQYPAQPGQYPAQPEQLPPPPSAAAPSRGFGGVESQPLAPPPGGTANPGQAPGASTQPASLPPGPGSAPSAARGTPAPPAPPAAGPPYDEGVTELPSQKILNPTAVFSGLDKITGRITTFDVEMNETVQFGALRVRPRACYTRPPTEAPNTTGFIEVDEVTLQGDVKRLFRGWMFAASPGLHGVEHSIYDVWLADCKGAQTAAVEEPAAPPPPATQRTQPNRTGTPRQSATPQRQSREQQPGAPASPPRAPRVQQY